MNTEYPLHGKLVAEAVGTFALVFVGAGAILSLTSVGSFDFSPFDPGGMRLAVALAHGLTIAVMVSAVGHISGGHFNPAVTLAMAVTRRIRPDHAFAYIISQILAATFAAALLAVLYPISTWELSNLGNPEVGAAGGLALNEGQVVLIEAVATFFLVWVIFGTAVDKKGPSKPIGGLVIGLTVSLDILFAGPLTGAAMNPARSFGPTFVASAGGVDTIVAGTMPLWANHLWYWVGPALGAVMAAGLYNGLYLRERE